MASDGRPRKVQDLPRPLGPRDQCPLHKRRLICDLCRRRRPDRNPVARERRRRLGSRARRRLARGRPRSRCCPHRRRLQLCSAPPPRQAREVHAQDAHCRRCAQAARGQADAASPRGRQQSQARLCPWIPRQRCTEQPLHQQRGLSRLPHGRRRNRLRSKEAHAAPFPGPRRRHHLSCNPSESHHCCHGTGRQRPQGLCLGLEQSQRALHPLGPPSARCARRCLLARRQVSGHRRSRRQPHLGALRLGARRQDRRSQGRQGTRDVRRIQPEAQERRWGRDLHRRDQEHQVPCACRHHARLAERRLWRQGRGAVDSCNRIHRRRPLHRRWLAGEHLLLHGLQAHGRAQAEEWTKGSRRALHEHLPRRPRSDFGRQRRQDPVLGI
eukprot:comp22184_c0_seq1/m.52229 comp22184_c0_seq1/g.52229  ORF comp22184_c0_seq1/g.52229 comp22184_c0_seq1/m.52229 type:complete len:383 (+) comp22184_c0_seq1:1294-2442(+)